MRRLGVGATPNGLWAKEFLHACISEHKGRPGEQQGLRGDRGPHPEGPQMNHER